MMKKYNRSEIFKRMWVLIKERGMSRSKALSRAWEEAKTPAKEGTERQIAYAKSLFNQMLKWCEEMKSDFSKGEITDLKKLRIEAIEQTKEVFIKKYENSRYASTIINNFRIVNYNDTYRAIVKEKKAARKAVA